MKLPCSLQEMQVDVTGM